MLLIWLYDLHLLVNRMTPDEVQQFADLATRKRLQAVCDSGLRRAQHCFDTPLPRARLTRLQPPRLQGQAEASAYFLTPRPWPWQVLYSDLRALPNGFNRLSLIKEHLFPPAAYMTARYATVHRALLPVLYVYRLWRGLMRFWQAVNS